MEAPPQCPVCLEIYDSVAAVPRVLSCGHSACQVCLPLLPRRHPQTIRCPSCSQLVAYPSHGATALPKNIDLLRLTSSVGPSFSGLPSATSPVKSQHLLFSPPGWSTELYSYWKYWIIPSDAISPSEIATELRVGLGFLSVLHGRFCSSPSFTSPWYSFREGQTVNLVPFVSISGCEIDEFVYGNAVRIVEFLQLMSGEEREQLGFIIRACSRQNRLCLCYGLWYNEEDRSLYLTFQRYKSGFLDRFGEGYDGNKLDVKNNLTPVCYGLICIELCEAILNLHREELIAGCLSYSCFSSDRYGRVHLDLSELLVTGRKARFCFIEFVMGKPVVSRSDIEMILTKMFENCVFLSPEVFLQLLREDGGFMHSCAYSPGSVGKWSDSWSLACLILHLSFQKSFTEELFVYMKSILGEKKECLDLIQLSPFWEDKFGWECGKLKEVFCDCLHVDCDRRPSITSLWKCARGLIVERHYDIFVDLELEEDMGVGHCLLFGRFCRLLHKELSKEMGDMYTTVVGGRVNIRDSLFNNGKVKVVDLKCHRSSITGLAIGGGFLFSSSVDKTIGMWSLQNYNQVHSFKGHEHHVMALAFVEAKQSFCISGDKGGGIFMWGVSAPLMDGPMRRWNEPKDWRYSGIQTLTVYDALYLYTGGGDSTIKIWSLQDYKLYHTMVGHKATVSSLSISGGVLYSGSWDGTVRLWSLNDHGLLAVLGEEKPGNPFLVMRVASVMDLVVAAYDTGGLKIWKEGGTTSVKVHSSPVTAAVLDGRLLFTGGLDKTLSVLEMGEDQYEVQTVHAGSVSYNSAVTAVLPHEGIYLCVGLEDGLIKIYVAEDL